MGRRKERRLAAMSAAGRRVKLDLYAEPSGDLGGSSAQNEVGGEDVDTKNQAGLPNSPSSSGKQRENPLVLLGQYSDDELDEGSSGEHMDAASGGTSVILDNQAKLTALQENEDSGFKDGNGPNIKKVEDLEMENALQSLDSLQKTEVGGTTDYYAAESGIKEQASGVPDTQAVGDVVLGWKLVFHEETNGYYYWNIATGETSWEIPDTLAQATESADGKKDVTDTGKNEGDTNSSMNTESNGSDAHKFSVEVVNEDCRGQTLDETKGNADLDPNHSKSSSPNKETDDHVTSPGSNHFSRKSAGVLSGVENAKGVDSLTCESGKELSTHLMKRCESLLAQLNSVTRSKCILQGTNQILKYNVEVEMRLADMKSLASYGSSLLPFWLHSERRIQQLEVAVYDVLQSLESEKFVEVDAGHESHENIFNVSGAHPGEKHTVFSSSGDSGASQSTTGATELPKIEMEVYSRGVSGAELVSSDGCLPTYSSITVGGNGEVGVLAGHCEVTPKTVLHSGEEVDMDIDMEVEDATPTSSSTMRDPSNGQYHVPSAGQESAAAEDLTGVPPPPEEEWIPPPPPDNEPFPPPPPEEPPEIPYPPPSDLAPVQSFSYPEQYNMSYTGPNYEYYAQANTDLQSSNLYVTAEVCQPTVSHPAVYFEALPGTYDPATLAVNSVEPGAFYTLQDGMTQLPVASSVFQSNTTNQTSTSEAIGPVGAQVQVESISLPKKVNHPATGASLDIQSSSQASQQELANISATEGVSLPSVSAASAPVASATAAKAQSKVTRNKKRTKTTGTSLRSNKKVSSLVDKWKAAKEELQEEEEEPKSAYEILEKKRQREIEEWHAQQIASGEAKDNANFQPLGGDWRERVKRKRAQLASEPSQTHADAVTEGNQQPDLDELSRGLPSGWQAYFDDSSKQVYYGNSITSETTWIRPTS